MDLGYGTGKESTNFNSKFITHEMEKKFEKILVENGF